MNKNILRVQLIPQISFGEDFGDDDNAALFQQGFDIKEFEVELGKTFTIADRFEEGRISCEEINYVLIKINMEGRKETVRDAVLLLDPGKYLFREDGLTIEEL